jgi:hypothetical protein
MNESIHIPEGVKVHFTAYASLSGIGRQVVARHIFKPIEHHVKIAQKVVQYRPTAKLEDGFINILAGGTGMVEVNKRVRSDIGLQRAFGREGCAEQSVIQDTLDACTEENVSQMELARQVIYQQHSQGCRHDYTREWQLLDADMTGRPCGPKAEFATPGYFAHQRNRRGRQDGDMVRRNRGGALVCGHHATEYRFAEFDGRRGTHLAPDGAGTAPDDCAH